MGIALRLLLVEDSEEDALLLLRELRRGGYDPTVERVEADDAMRAALSAQSWDLIVADYALPHFSAPAALAVVRELALDVPFLVVSGKIGEETAVALMKAGAHDYLMKDNLARLVPAVKRELREAKGRRERRRAELKLRELEHEILRVSEAEQRRIGHDLHDGLGQQLAGIRFMTSALQGKLAAKSLPEAAEAAQIEEMAVEAIRQARGLARGLCPVEPEEGGLAAALEQLAASIESTSRVSCSLVCEHAPPIREPATALHLYRIAQEAASNAIRHGRPKRIVIRLDGAGGRGTLTVRDDGVGLPAEATRGEGLGLRIMEHRASVIGGSLEVRPHDEGGTVVTCTFRP